MQAQLTSVFAAPAASGASGGAGVRQQQQPHTQHAQQQACQDQQPQEQGQEAVMAALQQHLDPKNIAAMLERAFDEVESEVATEKQSTRQNRK